MNKTKKPVEVKENSNEEVCEVCAGVGFDSETERQCKVCNGSGKK